MRIAALLLVVVTAAPAAEVKVTAPTRLDWTFALANQSLADPPAEWTKGYDSTGQVYDLHLPPKHDARKAAALILFVSPSKKPGEYAKWKAVCERRGIVFASPRDAGNEVDMPRRIRIVLDVLDDVRRRVTIDPDRCYIAGFSGGGRVACAIGFALPELFGGVMPICAGGELREESWLRQRVVDRVSVAHVTGESDFNRGEVERYRTTVLEGVGVRTRVWVAKGSGHAVPAEAVLTEAVAWLEDRPRPRKGVLPVAGSRAEQAAGLLAEAKSRLEKPATLYSGLMQLRGVHDRWPDVPEAAEAGRLLEEYDRRDERPWEAEDIAEQRRFLIAEARGLDRYASGPIPKQYADQHGAMLRGAIERWAKVIEDGVDAGAAAEAERRIPELKAMFEAMEK